ncbi:hypothetical protein IT084_15780 [Desulfallas sp. Bu1-1]|uniref:hypothetical protein n=1 Tax=Desulfallas sp. Bu1-1 TaxID=2787620 RepID=UPI00189CEB91|nr:hypothetical protein [Desulfallas sp. Bu1-1]MBF7084413.1 hypothetical protein [Desulfallas sp. Bu1-1]
MELPKIKLVSDFWDYYDHWFDGSDAEIVFERRSTGGMDRLQMLEYLKSLGLRVPAFGRVRDLYDRERQVWQGYVDITSVVVYLDERAHRGEGKVLLSLRDAMEQYPDHLATEYIPALPSGHGLTWRYLQVGDKIFWLKCTSHSDWRSNCGDVEIKVLSREKDSYNDKIRHPLYAVDFVPAGNRLYAVDFNVAPGIKGTGVEELLPPREAAEAIKKAIAHSV